MADAHREVAAAAMRAVLDAIRGGPFASLSAERILPRVLLLIKVR